MSTSTGEDSTSRGLLEAVSCGVCSEVYERARKTPLVLPCGHTFCRACLTVIEKQCSISCPDCRALHNNVQVSALTVNFSLLGVLPLCTGFTDFTHDKCKTHEDDLRYWCCTCDLPLCSLCLYSGHPQGHTVKLATIFVQEKKIELVEKIKFFFEDIENQEKEVKEDFSDIDALMKRLFEKNAYLKGEMVALTDLLSNTRKASDITSIKYMENLVKNYACKENVPSGSDVSKEEKVKDSQAAEAKAVTPTSEPCVKQPSSGQPSQNNETAETQRAIIDVHEGRVLLHSLAMPPSRALSFQVPSDVFLELSVADTPLGYVFINLWGHLRRAQQLLALCMGTMGPCLLGARASDTDRGMLTFKYVVDGKNKTRGQPLLLDLEWGGQYTKPQTIGYIATPDDGYGSWANTVAFGICMENPSFDSGREQEPYLPYGSSYHTSMQNSIPGQLQAPFGRVIGGLQVVQAAFHHNPVTEVTITRSGLVLPDQSL